LWLVARVVRMMRLVPARTEQADGVFRGHDLGSFAGVAGAGLLVVGGVPGPVIELDVPVAAGEGCYWAGCPRRD
jgi:hypothetical protein